MTMKKNKPEKLVDSTIFCSDCGQQILIARKKNRQLCTKCQHEHRRQSQNNYNRKYRERKKREALLILN